LNFSNSEENYLKAIFHLQNELGKVSTNALAMHLNASPASITDMMKKLSSKGLLDYRPYYGFTLTSDGSKAALMIIRRHRLWEYFLSEKLNFSWEEVHEVAEELEHVSSKKLIDKLDAYLGFPRFDPHGDPIPDTSGRLKKTTYISLTDMPLQQQAEVKSIRNQTPEALDYLKQKSIGLGSIVKIINKYTFDGSLEVQTKHITVNISDSLAKQLFVKKL
jgi:DtxR family Mn-dependent transcriptional regulator